MTSSTKPLHPRRESRPRAISRVAASFDARHDVLPAKVAPPALRQGVVPRPALVNRLRRKAPGVVTVVAGAGYGKTTLLAQWAAAESRPAAWVSVDARDDDPRVLLQRQSHERAKRPDVVDEEHTDGALGGAFV